MGAFLDKPKTEKVNEHGSGNGLRFGLSCMQGWRVEMEDSHTSVLGLPHGLKDWSFFAVYDGHAGANVSMYCSENLLDSITNNKDFKGTDQPAGQITPSVENVSEGIRTGFLLLDEKLRTLPELENGVDKSGSTAVCCIISPTHIFFANCGDSRGVLSRNGKCEFFTKDHKPFHPTERERIQNAGGSVMIQRVNGSLAVSRALGDFEYKCVDGLGACEQLVSPEPEITVQERTDKDEFVVLACDGIWDVMSNDEVCDFVRSRMQLTDNLESIANQVVDTCLYKGSRDNMSIVLLAFPNAPKVSQEAIQKEGELDERLERRIGEIVNTSEPGEVDLAYIMHVLCYEEIEGLPPGGGLVSKRQTIEEILHRLCPNTRPDDGRYLRSTFLKPMKLLKEPQADPDP
ncbi:protein phosphatase 1B-like isoform X1 [Branchiostoma lanceolatum]|uniref:Protein phosphatase 1B n=1 Tax=Branchiostoma lanceolatum TaxID=7740 RepID=A0A8J9ZRY0_BRALA|nr:PPM1B [Branchiostoma lanceolatum]